MADDYKDVLPITGKVEKVRVADLYVRYIPMVTPISIWTQSDFTVSMAIPTSPHVELLRLYSRGKRRWGSFKHTLYVKERLLRKLLGQPKWTKEYIRDYHLPKRFKVFESIKKRGYDKKKPIIALHEPFWTTRFGYKRSWLVGPEIWTGAGRAAACFVLGIEEIYVVWHRDRKPGSGDRGKFGSKLKNVKEVWDA